MCLHSKFWEWSVYIKNYIFIGSFVRWKDRPTVNQLIKTEGLWTVKNDMHKTASHQGSS